VGQPGLGAAARFELASLDVVGDTLRVTGAWSSVRGLRFVRPTLLADGRHVLARLEHKPWDPGTRPWVATFPWHGPAPDLADVRLSVAPSITVELATGASVAPRFTRPPAVAAPDELARITAERDQALAERDAATAWRDEALAERNRAQMQRDRAVAELDDAVRREAAAQSAMDVLRIDVTEARQSAERAQRSADEAQARADQAQREAIAARKDRDDARAELVRPVAPEERPVLGPFTSMSTSPPPTGHRLWVARAVVVAATILAIIVLAQVLT
jgi:hypothetical protein